MKTPWISLAILSVLLVPHLSVGEDVYKGSKVVIKGEISRWTLLVNGKPFFIKGVGCNASLKGGLLDFYFKLTKEMGANSIRRWGADADAGLVLDKAAEYGLMVNQGIWISFNSGFGTNPGYQDAQMKNILDIVERHKNHPAVLLWNIGNENIESLPKKEDKIAFCRFLNEVCKEIHKIDPNHPVAYTGKMGEPLKLIKDFAPSLDIYGSNAYAGISKFRAEWTGSKIKIPYIFSEYGSDGHWEVGLDQYQQPKEPKDKDKAEQFGKRWEDYIYRFEGDCFGGYAFLMEEKDEVSETWWGLTYEAYRRGSYWTLYGQYTGKKPANNAPEIKSVHLSPVGPVRAGRDLGIRINADDPDGDTVTYDLRAPQESGGRWKKGEGDNRFKYTATNAPGVYRLYVIVKDNHKNVATESVTFKVNP